jgi:hypothetical protein
MSQKNRQFLLDQIPKGKLSTEHFRITEAPKTSLKAATADFNRGIW